MFPETQTVLLVALWGQLDGHEPQASRAACALGGRSGRSEAARRLLHMGTPRYAFEDSTLLEACGGRARS